MQTDPSLQLGDFGVHEMPFPREGRAEAAAPRDPRRGKVLMETQPPLGPAWSPPGNPNFSADERNKFDKAEAFSKCLRVLVPAHLPPEGPGAAPGPGTAPAREPPAAGAAP